MSACTKNSASRSDVSVIPTDMSERICEVYADCAATVPVTEAVISEINGVLRGVWGNPSSLHGRGRAAREALEEARRRCAAVIGAAEDEIFFTASGSEADNWAVKGCARAAARSGRGRHIVSSAIEHHAVLGSLEALRREGFEVTLVGVDGDGVINADEFASALRGDTCLAVAMTANNEVGTVEPLPALSAAARERGIPFFTDAVQAVGSIPVNVGALGVDMLSLSGHKIGAPKGIGALYIRRGTEIEPLIDGGGQERALRGGTENVAFAVGLARAMEDAAAALSDTERVRGMRDRIAKALSALPGVRINGSPTAHLPGILNVGCGVDGEGLSLLLDSKGIAVSTGSACNSRAVLPSPVLLAMGRTPDEARSAVRISLSHFNTDADADRIIEALSVTLALLRRAGG